MFRHKMLVFILFIISLCTFSYAKAITNDLPLLGKVIYLDPGHGGTDPGAVYKEIYESNINLEITKTLATLLEQKGATIYLTRYGDYDLALPGAVNRKRSDLSRRGNIINRSECDLYISIHLNADVSSAWHGAQVFYDDVNEKNQDIAKSIQKYLKKELSTKREEKETASMYLHKRVIRPGVLIEVGFISNPNERYLLQQTSYQIKLSNAIINGIINYYAND